MSSALYSTAKDEYLYADIYNKLAEGFAALRQEQCLEDIKIRGGEYARHAAEQNAIMDGQTAYLGGRHFVSAAGEIWLSYYCRPITVRARRKQGCYDALPITLQPHNYDRYVTTRQYRYLHDYYAATSTTTTPAPEEQQAQ